jgi:hypothetical protein
MNEGKRRFFSGDSLQQAIIQAANYFNLDPDWVAYRSLDKRHGFLKTRRKVVIEVDPDNPRRESPVSAPPTVRPTPPPPPSSYLTREPSEPRPPAPPREPRPPARERGGEGRPAREPRGGDRRSQDRGRRDEGRGGSREGGERPRRRGGEMARARAERAGAEAGAVRSEHSPAEGLVTLPENPRRVSERFPAASGPAARPRTHEPRRPPDHPRHPGG